MALLIQNLDRFSGDADEWRRVFAELLPDRELRTFPEAGVPANIDCLAFMRPDFNALPELPNLCVMFTRSAGADPFIRHPRLPQVPLGKLEPSGGDPVMTEYHARQVAHEWHRTRIVRPEERHRLSGLWQDGASADAGAAVG